MWSGGIEVKKKKASNRNFWIINFIATALYIVTILVIRSAFYLPEYFLHCAPVGLLLILIFLNGYEKDGLLASWI